MRAFLIQESRPLFAAGEAIAEIGDGWGRLGSATAGGGDGWDWGWLGVGLSFFLYKKNVVLLVEK
jgi:hypothetical protein